MLSESKDTDVEIGHAGTCGVPCRAAGGGEKHPAERSCNKKITMCREGKNMSVGQVIVDGTPAAAIVAGPEHPPVIRTCKQKLIAHCQRPNRPAREAFIDRRPGGARIR